jgi:uroporphyrin-III C-methyltransferase
VTVHLVGAGPGHPDLLTLRAARLLAAADVVVHDRLVHPGVLDLVRPGAPRIDVGKDAGDSHLQERINATLVELGRVHDCVVRLKGGDPFVFGRGGEEAEALRAAGIAVEVVPGVSSAVAAPAAAGVPVTHRDHASAVTIVTGHPAAGAPPIDWAALARVGGTVVVLMGVGGRRRIVAGLLDGGLAASTPVCVITRGTYASQEVVRMTLAELPDAGVEAPSVLVIGSVAALDLASASIGTGAVVADHLGTAEVAR